MTWGRKPTCKCGTCDKCKRAAYMRGWYQRKTMDERRAWADQRDRELLRAADRARHEAKKGDFDYDRRRRAIFTVNNAIRDGRLARGACEVCGATFAQGHHDDYDRPLEVRWLCPEHHALAHNDTPAHIAGALTPEIPRSHQLWKAATR